jgi:Uma2 family endonuclease
MPMATVSPRRKRPQAPAPQPKRITIVTDRLTLEVPASAFTLPGFRVWATADDFPERVRVTFVSGEITLDMSNEELETHVAVKGEVARALMNLNRQQKLGKFYGDGVLLSNEQGDVSNNPDAVFVTYDTLQAGRVNLVPRAGVTGQYIEMTGTPDWVLEVLSDSSVQKDTRRLREAYHRAGIPEYWLVDARGAEIAFHILLHRKNGYVAAPSKDGWQRSRVFGRSFRLERQHDELGLWEYTLHIQES